jgi:hypothetical protein
MLEIGTSGSMSENGKRSVAKRPKLPRPFSTLPSRTWRDVRPESEMRRITDIAERLLAVSINEYAPWPPPASAEANSRGFHESFSF